MKKLKLILPLLAIVLVFAYTNCSGQKFNFSSSEKFNPSEINSIDCKQVIEIPLPSDGSLIHIPARGSDDVCYSVKLISAASARPSSSNPIRDADVLSNDFDSGDTRLNSNPYVMGRSVVNLFLEGPRAIMLSGSVDGLSEIRADNFILVGVMPTAQIYEPQFYTAYGTSDCRIYNVAGNPIGTTAPYNNSDGTFYLSYKNVATLFVPFATGGTASVVPQRVDGDMATNRSYSIDFRALDCGGVGYSSDTYLSFK
jgi:hypothetical protein